MVSTEVLVPLKIDIKKLIICQRKCSIPEMNRRLMEHVLHKTNETELKMNIIYSDELPVLQLLDKPGITDFEPATVNVREVTYDELNDERIGQIKVLIYGVASFPFNEEFSLFFMDMLKGKAQYTVLKKNSPVKKMVFESKNTEEL